MSNHEVLFERDPPVPTAMTILAVPDHGPEPNRSQPSLLRNFTTSRGSDRFTLLDATTGRRPARILRARSARISILDQQDPRVWREQEDPYSARSVRR